MAVYKRSYKRYDGPLTDERWRFRVVQRYALKTVFEAKLNTTVFVASFFPHLVALILIYLLGNLEAVTSLNIPVSALRFLSVNEDFFMTLFRVESAISFVLIALIGPGLVSPDLTNNALPLYFSRPFSRVEYVLGKLCVLLLVISLTSWIPGLLLIGIHLAFADLLWLADHLRIVVAIVVGSWIWMLTTSLIALAVSAWVRWKPVAVGLLFGIFFVASAFGTVCNLLLDTKWGTLFDMRSDMLMIWRWLFLGEPDYLVPFRGTETLPVWAALLAMILISAASLFLLSKRVRATQAVR